MTDVERRFHETWLGMVQPIDGLVVSVPVLVDAQCMERQPPHVQTRLHELCPRDTIADLRRFLAELLGHAPESFDTGETLPSLYVPEGRQTVRPTLALRALPPATGHEYVLLVWQLPTGLPLDKPEDVTGTWHYPPAAKFERLLRHARVPIGLLTNNEVVRLVYAPHGESSGAITFRIDDMASVGGRPILDAFVMLLSANRFFGVEERRALPALLAESRKRQADVTTDLAGQVFDALQILLAGFQAAAERDGRDLLDEALAQEGDVLYKGLLTVLLRLVFVLYAEDRALLPVEHEIWARNYSVMALFEQLQGDRNAWPDSMSRRFGAWGRLIAIFRAIFLGVDHGEMHMPPRRGQLFDPHRFPFLEGWGPSGNAPIVDPLARADVRVPTVDDETVFRVLEKLLLVGGQRLSYRALDVEQIGSVYEGLMGFHVIRTAAESVCLRPDRLWLAPDEVLAVAPAQRAKWIKEHVGLPTAQADKLARELSEAQGLSAQLDALAKHAAGARGSDPLLQRARVGQLVLQPGEERRRTSSHYTPRSLSAPIVRRTLEPLLAVMGEAPPSERILNLKVCDPAMGSGAFLVEACRFLAEHVVAAWTREGTLEAITQEHGDPLLHARRLVAQRCLYGVDKNDAAVELAKLSLWLVTLARGLPFTFVDHALRHGDSLVGLDFDQIRSFHWKPGKQLELFTGAVNNALDEAIAPRERILALAGSARPEDQREKESLLTNAMDALKQVRLIADVCVGVFFAKEKDKDRERERERRLELVNAYLRSDAAAGDDLIAMQADLRARVPAFHWHVEFPEVFYAARPDPLDEDRVNGAAYMDAFVGNPPFAGGRTIRSVVGDEYTEWLGEVYGYGMNVDLSARFFTRAADMLGANGTMGLIATNTIAQGDTRTGGLLDLVRRGFVIFDATDSMEWPGSAAVTVSVVHLACGTASSGVGSLRLDGRAVDAIDSRLTEGSERADAQALAANADLSFVGSYVLGTGFTLKLPERDALVAQSPHNGARIFPYLGGEEVNTSPTQTFDRYVINFGQLTLEEAEAWPDLMNILRERVKPERDIVNRDTHRKYWWHFGDKRPALYEALASLKSCMVTSIHSKHLIIARQPTDRVFSHAMIVFPFECASGFAALQSRIHESWARLLSSSLEDRLRYSASDCFETFPFPQPDPRTVIPALEAIGETLYTTRAKYMVDENVGLTITYNRLKDPAVQDPRIQRLRMQHEEMDRAVLDAYGWSDIAVPPYCIDTDADKQALERFENEVIDRLFALNAQRAEQEKLLGLGKATKGAKGTKAKRAKKDEGEPGLPGVG